MLSLDVSMFPSYDTSRLQQILQEKQVDLPKVAKQGLSTIIADPDIDSSGALNVQSKFRVHFLICEIRKKYPPELLMKKISDNGGKCKEIEPVVVSFK